MNFRLGTFFGLLATFSTSLYGDATVGYTVSQINDLVYQVNLADGSFSTVASLPPGTGPNAISLINPTTAYVSGPGNDIIYRIDLTSGSVEQVTPSPISGAAINRIALANTSTAYVSGFLDHNIYKVNLIDGSFSKITPLPLPGAIGGLALEMTLEGNPTVGYASVANFGIYSVDLQSGSFVQIATSASSKRALALANNTTGYFGSNNIDVNQINLINGNVSLSTTIPGMFINGLALSDASTAYISDLTMESIYRINLSNGSYFLVSSFPGNPNLGEIALVLQIGTEGLNGNNFHLANYLNNNAPYLLLPMFALQNSPGIALESISPARNAFPTFVAQSAQFALGRVIADHLGQRRWIKNKNKNILPNQMTAFNDCLLARNKSKKKGFTYDKIKNTTSSNTTSSKYSSWLGTFGEYAHQKKAEAKSCF